MVSREPGRLVGRDRELEVLAGLAVESGAGRPAVAVLTGDPGVGKTRLLDAFAERSAAAGMRVLRGGASEAEGMPPYLPFVEALGGHVRMAAAGDLRRQAGELAGGLATILPELATRLGEVPPAHPLPPEQARLPLFQAGGGR